MTTNENTPSSTAITAAMDAQLKINFTPEPRKTDDGSLDTLSTPSREDTGKDARESLRVGTWEERQAKAAAIADGALSRLGDSLEAGHTESFKEFLRTMGKFHHYSLSNVILIAIQQPTATHVAGFHTWKKLGRSVKKGESGIIVMAPVTRKVGETHEVDHEGNATTSDIRQIVNVKPVFVFDVSQTEGKALPQVYVTDGDVSNFSETLRQLIADEGIELSHSSALGTSLGISLGGHIKVSDKLSPAQEFRVLAHELAHELLHKGENRKDTTRQSRELEAEAVAYVVCSGVGIDVTESSTNYIHLYQGNKKGLTESLTRIRATASRIVGELLG